MKVLFFEVMGSKCHKGGAPAAPICPNKTTIAITMDVPVLWWYIFTIWWPFIFVKL